MKTKSTVYIVQAAVIAALYAALTILQNTLLPGTASMAVQFRVAEVLTILAVFTPAAIPGLFLGCIIGNVLGGAIPPDIIFGSLATLAGACITYLLRKKNNVIIATIPPIAANTLVVPFVLKYAYGIPLPLPFIMLTVGIGEVISCGVLGSLFGKVLKPYCRKIFGDVS